MKKINIISFFIMIICLIILSFSVLRLDVLPDKYLIIYFILISILSIIFGLITFINKNKIIRYIITFIIILISILSCFISFIVLDKANAFLENIEEVEEVSIYYLISLKESNYKDIVDLKDKSIGISSNGTDYNAIKLLNDKIKYNVVKYDNLFDLYDDLLNNKLDCIYIDSNIKMLFDEVVNDFSDKTMIISELNIKSSMESNDEEINNFKDSINIYISGIDTYGTINLRSRSDVNMLATINTKNHEILLTSIPRDYYVQLHDKPGYKDKLTHAGIYGVNTSIQTIQDFMGIEINYYTRVNFSTLEKVVDAIGGIDVYSDKSFRPHTNKALYINKGMVHMDGKTALAFARERYAYESGDRHRVQNQQDVLKAIINKATSDVSILTRYTTLLNSISPYFQTNIDMNEISEIVKIQLDKMPSWTIKQTSLDGTGSKQPTYSMGNTPLYVMIPNQETIDIASKYINGMTKGKTFNELGLN